MKNTLYFRLCHKSFVKGEISPFVKGEISYYVCPKCYNTHHVYGRSVLTIKMPIYVDLKSISIVYSIGTT